MILRGPILEMYWLLNGRSTRIFPNLDHAQANHHMKILRYFTLFLLCAIGSFPVSGQETIRNIDSAFAVLEKMKDDTSKVVLLQRIGGHYNVAHLDSAQAFLLEGYDLAKKLGYRKGEWINLNTLGNYHERKTQYDSAMASYQQALSIVNDLKSTKGEAVVLNNIATIHIRKGEYQKAIDLLFDALKAEEQLGNEYGIAQAYNNIGICYYYMQNFDKTTEYLTQALEIQERLGKEDGLINGYMNVAAIQDYQKKYEAAIASYKKALVIAERIGDVKKQGTAIANIGMMYTNMKQTEKAEDFLTQAIAIREGIEDYYGMATVYVSSAVNWLSQKQWDKSEAYFNKALELADLHDLDLVRREIYSGMAALEEGRGDYRASSEYLRKYVGLKDSLLNEENIQAVAEMEAKYENEKSEKQIAEQRAEIAEKDLINRRKNTWIFGGFGLALLLGILGYLLFKQQKLRNQQLKKESELKSALARIETQNKLQEQRLRISRDLHDNIGSQLTFVASSVDNLKYGLKEKDTKVTDKLGNISAFTMQTIYELRDTIWAMNKEEISFEDLQTRISNFIDNAGVAAANVRFTFEVDPKISRSKVFTSLEGINLYRIIQEAVNNAIKYAQASSIKVLIEHSGQGFLVQIKDDGKGFDTTKAEMGNGLHNMKKRAREMGGTLTIHSNLGEGTAIDYRITE